MYIYIYGDAGFQYGRIRCTPNFEALAARLSKRTPFLPVQSLVAPKIAVKSSPGPGSAYVCRGLYHES